MTGVFFEALRDLAPVEIRKCGRESVLCDHWEVVPVLLVFLSALALAPELGLREAFGRSN